MALNPSAAGKKDTECTRTGDQHREGGEPQKNSSAASAAANQNGDQAGCGDGVMPDREAPERRRSVQADARSFSTSPLPGQKPNEDVPRRNFQIPRKIRERKGLYQLLAPESREFEDLVKLISSFYLDSSSRGMFSYSKARLIHNELLEKEFIEKRREMKQEGRTDQELTESYCFLYPDKSKLQWICEKGLSVGHARITTVGNPSSGVYLSKYSDLLQINPFEAGTSGDMIVFKVMRGRIKHIFDNMPKNAMEPTPKFDCHLSKSASRVTSLLSYRAFELTQQYFFEFAFDEIKARPRHVCPYAVVSFQYKGKETAAAPMTAHRFNTISPEGCRGKSCYTIWSGPLVNKGQELFPVCLRSSKRAYLPFKLPERLEVNRGMQLDQVKRKLPSVLFSWDTYSMSREVLKYGMSCSLFDVVDGKGKPTCGSLAALVNKLERDRMVLVKSLLDRGFLFLLSSAQMLDSKERRGRVEKNLQALFIFQESRMVVKYSSRLFESDLLAAELRPACLPSVESFIPALHYALFKLRPNPGKDPSFGVERQATDYLTRMDLGTVRPFILPDYKHVDDRTKALPLHRPKCNMDAALRSYVHNPGNYVLPLAKAKDIIDKIQNPVPTPAPAPIEYSPVSDWGGSDRGSDRAERFLERLPQEKPPPDRAGLERVTQDSSRQRSGLAPSVGAQLQPRSQIETQAQSQRLRLSQSEYDKDKMKQLLKLIHLHKKTLVKDPGKEKGDAEDVGAWVSRQLKRKYEGDDAGGVNKHPRTDPLSNGEPSRVAQTDEPGDEAGHSDNLTEVMESMGIYDTDLRSRTNTDASSVHETQRLLKILLTTLNKAMTQGSLQVNHGEPSAGVGRSDLAVHDPDFRKRSELHLQTNYAEDMDCSPGSPVSPGSPAEQPSTSENPMWVVRTDEDKAQFFPELKVEPKLEPKLEQNLEPKPECKPEHKVESKSEAKVELKPDPKFQSKLELKPEAKVVSKSELKYEPKVEPDPEPLVEPTQELKPEPKLKPEFEPKVELESRALAVADGQSELQTPTVMEVEKTTVPPTLPLMEEVPPRPSISLDTILNQEIHSLTSDIKNIMQSHQVYYSSRLPLRSPLRQSWLPNCSFSDFVVPFVSSVPIQGHVKALCEKMDKLIPAPPAPVEVTSPPRSVTTSNLTTPAPAATPPPVLAATPPPAPTATTPPAPTATPPPAPTTFPKAKAVSSQSNTTASSQSRKKLRTKARTQAASSEVAGNAYSPSQIAPDSPGSNSAPGTRSGLLATTLIGQLKPEVFSSLVEIFKDVTKNTVKFYIYSGDEGEESTVCRQIKEYLISLGNRECSPQTFLENSGSLDKLLIIIQNEDIAAHVHKIPALVSLKKLPSVSFAGVDTLDDVKNHTYNELFVSGGFIVSDEFVLNPDFITQDRLQGLLKFLEEQSTPEQPWQWKVHCKSQKKLKELGRLNTNAMGLLNLLTAYQKKHLVEFLPYHECDTQSRQAPDLECLVKLQAQYTQQRHLIFLTERPFEMFLQYSRNGIVIASIDDVMSGFHSLIGSINQNELPTPPSTVVNEECVEQEDMSLDSDDGEPADVSEPSEQNQHVRKEKPPLPPPPDMEEFRPPLPDHHLTPEITSTLPDYSALKTVISQFKASQMASSDIGSLSPGGFPVNPHQSFLCPSASWSSYTGSSSYAASPAYPASPCSSTQEQEYRPPTTAPGTVSTPPTMTTAGPLANLGSLPLEVKPPPPPHLMLMGHTYGSDNGGAGAVGAFAACNVPPLPRPPVESSPLSTSLPYANQSDAAQKGYMAGIPKSASGTPTQQAETPQGGPGESAWGAAGSSTCETANSQGEATSGPMDPSRLPKSGERETLGSGAPGNQGGRTHVNCTDNFGGSMGIPTAATRGSAIVRPKLPPHPMSVGGYGSIGGMPAQMDHGLIRGAMGPGSLGSYRGRGAPPVGMWPRPGRGHERGGGPGGGPCSWGYPGGRGAGPDYYLDFTYPFNYAPE